MVANLNGVIFDQVYGDNSGGPEFDTDGDGTATQEDEFLSFTNTSGSTIDISGWQVWLDIGGGAGAPDPAVGGLFHTFPEGTTLEPGETLYVINEISGPAPAWAQEASEGGIESGAGGTSTNFMGEGAADGSFMDATALVDPETGEYILFNASTRTDAFAGEPDFPGTTKVGEVDAYSVQNDQGAGSSYQYDPNSGTYTYGQVYVPCFGPGTRIDTPHGEVAIEDLGAGDVVLTRDNGPQPIRMKVVRTIDFSEPHMAGHKPVLFKPGSLGPDLPNASLLLSPQHRVLIDDGTGASGLGPAKGFTGLARVRTKAGAKRITYTHLVLPQHDIIFANGVAVESYYHGAYAARAAGPRFTLLHRPGHKSGPARPLLNVRQTRTLLERAQVIQTSQTATPDPLEEAILGVG